MSATTIRSGPRNTQTTRKNETPRSEENRTEGTEQTLLGERCGVLRGRSDE